MTSAFLEELSEAEVEAERELYAPLTGAVRELVDATIRTLVDEDEIRTVTEEVRGIVARLRSREIPGPFGLRFTSDGAVRNHGNAVMGLRNAIAPPLEVQSSPELKRAWADCHLGAAYEGPPGLVHGGVSALLLDQVFGHAAAIGGAPGMTGTLTVVYRRGTPLGHLHIEGTVDRIEGLKTYVVGHIADSEGVTVEAEGVFILPRWARGRSLDGPFE